MAALRKKQIVLAIGEKQTIGSKSSGPAKCGYSLFSRLRDSSDSLIKKKYERQNRIRLYVIGLHDFRHSILALVFIFLRKYPVYEVWTVNYTNSTLYASFEIFKILVMKRNVSLAVKIKNPVPYT